MQIDRPPKRFYFDDGHFTFWEKPWKELNVYIIGGFAIGFDKERDLEARIKSIKEEYYLELRHPIKWNLKDNNLKKYYEENDEKKRYEYVYEISDKIRNAFLSIADEDQFDITLFSCALIRLKIKDKPLKSYQRCFTNLLQRISMNVGDTDDCHSVFIDYFKDEDTSALVRCYSSGYYNGKDLEGNDYRAGSLLDKGFFQSLYFGKTIYNQFLQLADIFNGCTCDFLKYCFKKKNFHKVMKFFPKIKDKFCTARGSDTPFRAGIAISPERYYEKLEEGYTKVKQELEEVPF